jgi:hypothetical protein
MVDRADDGERERPGVHVGRDHRLPDVACFRGDGVRTTLHAELRPDAHPGWRGPPAPDALDRWLSTMTKHGRAG